MKLRELHQTVKRAGIFHARVLEILRPDLWGQPRCSEVGELLNFLPQSFNWYLFEHGVYLS